MSSREVYDTPARPGWHDACIEIDLEYEEPAQVSAFEKALDELLEKITCVRVTGYSTTFKAESPSDADLEAEALDHARRLSAEDIGWEMDGEEPDDVP